MHPDYYSMAQDVGYEPSLESPILGRYSRETLLFPSVLPESLANSWYRLKFSLTGFPFWETPLSIRLQFLQHASLTRTAWDRPRMSPEALPGAFDAAMITMAHMREIASR